MHNNSFDRTLSLLVLHFVPQPDRAVAEMQRVTRSGGVVAAVVWDAQGGYVANRIFFDTAAMLDPRANELRARNYTRPMTRPGELTAAWRKSDFDDVQAEMLTIRMEFSSFDNYWNPLVKEGPAVEYVKSLSVDHQHRLRDAIQKAYLDVEPDGLRSYAAAICSAVMCCATVSRFFADSWPPRPPCAAAKLNHICERT